MISNSTLRTAIGFQDGSGPSKLKTFASMAAFLFIFATVLPAEVYQYTGVDYTTFTGVGGTYSTSEAVNGTFTLSSPLGMSDTAFDATATVVSWTINDGVNTLCDTGCSSTLINLLFSTDPSGNITDWNFEATDAGIGVDVSSEGISPANDTATTGGDSGTSTVAGTWEDVTPTPEPGTIGMMLAGTALLFGLHRLRAGKATV
jgi:hypothetical protein